MSHLERTVDRFLGEHPEVEKCYRRGLINRRALARHLIGAGVVGRQEFEAVLATIRRHDFGTGKERDLPDLFPKARIALKDRILVLDFEKEKALLERLEALIRSINYDRGDTLKIVVGSASLKVILDEKNEAGVRHLFERFKVRSRLARVSEISMIFPEAATETRGILALIAREFMVHDITIAELLTASPELLIYLRDEHVTKAFELLRGLQTEAT